MAYIIEKEQTRTSGNAYLFQGREYGNTPISFFWVQSPPGKGPNLHAHPYEEVFVIQEGHATFTVGDSTIEADGGQIVVVPAGVPHAFKNTGQGLLKQIDIHPSAQVITQWLEN